MESIVAVVIEGVISHLSHEGNVILSGVFSSLRLAVYVSLVFCPGLLPDDYTKLSIISDLTSAIVDPLLLYIPLINEGTKCLGLDNTLMIVVLVLRTMQDLRYLRNLLSEDGLLNESNPNSLCVLGGEAIIESDRKKIVTKYGRFAIDVVSVLPITQVTIILFLPKMRGLKSLGIMKFLNSLILLQFLARAYPIYKFCKQLNENKLNKKNPVEDEDEPEWLPGIINFFIYILASHVFGAFWYFFSIQRELDCWGYACRNENGCEFTTSCDHARLKNATLINTYCPIVQPNAAVFDFGVFLYALQSGVQGSKNFPEKFLQCFSWGLRNLSSFASNLNTSSYGWETLFVIVISISGLILFIYLLGHMQESYRSDSLRRKMEKIMKPKIKSMLSDYGVPIENGNDDSLPDPDSIHWKIQVLVRKGLEQNEDIIVESMFSIFSLVIPGHEELTKTWLLEIKRKIFLNKLKEVEGLRDKADEMLIKICEHLEPMIYKEKSHIIREGEPLDMMFYVTQGSVLTYATNDGSSSSSGTIQLIEKEPNGLYGAELLTLLLAETPSSRLSSLPISDVTIKCHEKVEVFYLRAADLQRVMSEPTGQNNTATVLPVIISP